MDFLDPAGEIRITGVPASAGVVFGPLLVLEDGETPLPYHAIAEEDVPSELRRLEAAIQQTREQLSSLQVEVSKTMGEKDAAVFEAHILVLEDPTILGAVAKQIGLKKVNVEQVYCHTVNHYADALAAQQDAYLAERAVDVRDVGKRVLMNLTGREPSAVPRIDEPCIIVAHDLSPSDTAQLPPGRVLGFVTRAGSRTSHSAILARSMDIAAVVGIGEPSVRLLTGMSALIDGIHGVLIINPSEETRAHYGDTVTRHHEVQENLDRLRATMAQTTDGRHVILSANMELLAELDHVVQSGAEGVGLFRTEFLFIKRSVLPSEEEQYQAYVQAARAVKPHNIILRTLDVGGDKIVSPIFQSHEINPFLGVRAIRFCLAHPELFATQLRAMLRASAEGNIKIMYPMVSCLKEIQEANAILFRERDKLLAEGVPVAHDLDIGIMIELPAAALIADCLAKHVSFFSIGTNDLIQYTLAIDRGNERVAHLYDPTHPSVIQLIALTVKAAHDHGIWCGVCGELAGDFVMTPLLVGLGVDEFSCGAAQVPRIKRVIQNISLAEAKILAEEVLAKADSELTQKRLVALAEQRFAELFE